MLLADPKLIAELELYAGCEFNVWVVSIFALDGCCSVYSHTLF